MNKLLVTPAPHSTKQITTNAMMYVMLLALLPTAISGVVVYGLKALGLIIISTVTGYFCDTLLTYLKTNKFAFADLSGAVTGFMMALILPVSVPYYIPAIGSFVAVVVVKFLFGGIGKNIFNPAGAARVILGLMFTALSLSLFKGIALEGNVSSPLYYYLSNDYSTITIRSLFFGTAPGAIGTASIFCILVCGIALMCYKITDWTIPLGAIVTFTITAWVGKGAVSIIPYLFSGSFMFVAMFMLTDPTTSPNTVWGKLFSGLIFGAIAGLFRIYGVLGETGVFVALLAVNLISPLLDKIFAPRPLGLNRGY